mmetsp:Transcript_38181/g.36543  ORF Transcript_38181/g.36543 Transcript_38181/m.36543 type:complete len:81 (+) Transcript_38181:2140-2382(+)
MGLTEPFDVLTPHLPQASLISLPVLTSVIGMVIIQLSFQVFIFFNVQQQDWYVPLVINEDDDSLNYVCYINTVLFMISSY